VDTSMGMTPLEGLVMGTAPVTSIRNRESDAIKEGCPRRRSKRF